MKDLLEEARLVKARYEQHWLEITGVSSVGIGLDETNHPVIIIRVLRDAEALSRIPEQINGIPIRIEKGTMVVAQ